MTEEPEQVNALVRDVLRGMVDGEPAPNTRACVRARIARRRRTRIVIAVEALAAVAILLLVVVPRFVRPQLQPGEPSGVVLQPAPEAPLPQAVAVVTVPRDPSAMPRAARARTPVPRVEAPRRPGLRPWPLDTDDSSPLIVIEPVGAPAPVSLPPITLRPVEVRQLTIEHIDIPLLDGSRRQDQVELPP